MLLSSVSVHIKEDFKISEGLNDLIVFIWMVNNFKLMEKVCVKLNVT